MKRIAWCFLFFFLLSATRFASRQDINALIQQATENYNTPGKGQPIREAFINAQTQLRHLKKEYEDPYFWAAWVMVE